MRSLLAVKAKYELTMLATSCVGFLVDVCKTVASGYDAPAHIAHSRDCILQTELFILRLHVLAQAKIVNVYVVKQLFAILVWA